MTTKTSMPRWVRLTWVDNSGVVCAKAVHRSTSAGGGIAPVGLSFADQAMTTMGDLVTSSAGLGPIGEVELVPDLNTFAIIPYAISASRVFGDMMIGGRPWEYCPRDFLRRAISAATRFGLDFQVAFESEFYLLEPSECGLCPFDTTRYAQADALDKADLILTAIADALETQGVIPLLAHAESGPGQFEIPVLHKDPLAAADTQVIVRETTRAIAAHHGLRATFAPKPWPSAAASGAHIHLSLWSQGVNVTADPCLQTQLSPTALAFIAGLLDHHGALLAVLCPTGNSAERLRVGGWAGALRGWGYGNKEAAIRIPRVGACPITNIEIKCVDSTCNPYLALGSLIWCGIDGMLRELKPDAPIHHFDATSVSDTYRVEDALVRLSNDECLRSAFGEGPLAAYRAVKMADLAAYANLSPDVRLAWLVDRF